VDKQGTVQYRQLVKEVTEEPNYEAALEAIKKLV
jgi:thiol peroxidase